MRILLRSAALVVGVAVAVTLLAAPAEAHAELVRSDPVDGAALALAPTAARLWFSEEIAGEFSSAQLVTERGRTVSGTSVRTPSGDPTLLEVALPPLAAGTYVVVWRVLAADDGHPASGVVVFSVGRAAPAGAVPVTGEPAAPTSGTPADVLLRWLGLCLLAAIVGGLAVAGPILAAAGATPEAVADRVRYARRRLLAMVGGCAVLAAGVGLANLVVEGRRAAAVAGRPFPVTVPDLLTGTRWGHLWLAAEAALVALAAIVLLTHARLGRVRSRAGPADPARAAGSVAVVGLVLTVVWTRAAGSHAESVEAARTVAVAADALHILAALLWLGALPALALVIWPRGPGPGGSELIRACRAPLTGVLVISATVLVATGLYGSGRQVAAPAALLTTPYGRILLAKGVLLAVLGGLGLANSALLHGWRPARPGRLVRPAAGGSPSRRLILVEAAVGATLLVAAGLLAETGPPREQPVPIAAAQPATASGTVADLVVSLSATPGRPGTNVFTVQVASARRPPPAPVDGVTLDLPGYADPGAALSEIEPGHYLGTAQLDGAGPAEITVVVHRSGNRVTVALPWQVSPRAGPAPPKPARRLAPYVNALALCLLALVLLVSAWLFTRRPRLADLALARPVDATRTRPVEPIPAGRIPEDVR